MNQLLKQPPEKVTDPEKFLIEAMGSEGHPAQASLEEIALYVRDMEHPFYINDKAKFIFALRRIEENTVGYDKHTRAKAKEVLKHIHYDANGGRRRSH